LSVLRSALIYWPLTILCTLALEPISLAAALFDPGIPLGTLSD